MSVSEGGVRSMKSNILMRSEYCEDCFHPWATEAYYDSGSATGVDKALERL